MRRYLTILALSVGLGAAAAIAILSLAFALALIDTRWAPATMVTFLKNVGYSVFAGGVILGLVELSRALMHLIRADLD